MSNEEIRTHRAVAIRWEKLPTILREIHGMKPRYDENDLLKSHINIESMDIEVTEDAILRQIQDLIQRLTDEISPLDLNNESTVWSVKNIISLLNSDLMQRSSKKGKFEDALQELLKGSAYEIKRGLLSLEPKK